jgi:hypothetical protein
VLPFTKEPKVEFNPLVPISSTVGAPPAPTVMVYAVPAVTLTVPVRNPPAPPPPACLPPPAPPPPTTKYCAEVAPAGAVHIPDEKKTAVFAGTENKFVGAAYANVPEDVNV